MIRLMLTDANLAHFVHVFRANPGAEITPHPPHTGGAELERLLQTVGGWALYDFRFLPLAEVAAHKELWDRLSRDFEAGGSDNWSHALWNREWTPLAHTAHEQWAWDPVGAFGGAPGQVVSFDFKGGQEWLITPSLADWVKVMSVGLLDESDALGSARQFARSNGLLTTAALPKTLEAQRSPERFHAGERPWIELVHPDGTHWAVREERGGYALRLGDPADPVIRRRECAKPKEEVERLVAEQRAAGLSERTPGRHP